MANYNDTKEQLEKTEERLVNAEAVLNQFKEGENDGELLKRLRIKAISGELSEGGKGREGEIRRRGEEVEEEGGRLGRASNVLSKKN